MIRRPPRSTQSRSSAASDVYKRQCPGSGAGNAKGCNAPGVEMKRARPHRPAAKRQEQRGRFGRNRPTCPNEQNATEQGCNDVVHRNDDLDIAIELPRKPQEHGNAGGGRNREREIDHTCNRRNAQRRVRDMLRDAIDGRTFVVVLMKLGCLGDAWLFLVGISDARCSQHR